MDNKNMKVAYSVTERSGKSYWTRIGVGYVNKDGSWNLKLDAFPIGDAKLQIRDWEPRDEQQNHLPPSQVPAGPTSLAALGQEDYGINGRRARAPADPFA